MAHLRPLASQVNSAKQSYDAALDSLQKPIHVDRISPLTIHFMLVDYGDSIGSVSQPNLVYLMLIGEAGRIKQIATAASAAFRIVTESTAADEHGNILRFVNNLEPFLIGAGQFEDRDKAAAQRIRGRFGPSFKPSDF